MRLKIPLLHFQELNVNLFSIHTMSNKVVNKCYFYHMENHVPNLIMFSLFEAYNASE